MKKVYACFTTDVIHEGHEYYQKGKEYGYLIVGVMRTRRKPEDTGFLQFPLRSG